MKKNLIIIILLVIAIIVIGYGSARSLLPLKIGANNSTTSILEQPVEENIPVFLTIGDEKYQAEIKSNSTAYDLMKMLQTTQNLKFNAKEYEGMGVLVEEINGIKNDLENNKFWIYYINDAAAQEGISTYILQPNDVISWKFEAYKF